MTLVIWIVLKGVAVKSVVRFDWFILVYASQYHWTEFISGFDIVKLPIKQNNIKITTRIDTSETNNNNTMRKLSRQCKNSKYP